MEPIQLMIKKLFYICILLVDSTPTFKDKLVYYLTLIISLSPIVYIIEGLTDWFNINTRFFTFIMAALIINLLVGALSHHIKGTFDWWEFLIRNSMMAGCVCITYTVLEMVRITGGDNTSSEVFKIIIQVSTLLYPVGKILKNIHIMSKGEIPSEFIMKRLYNFEKSGDLKALYDSKNNNQINNNYENK